MRTILAATVLLAPLLLAAKPTLPPCLLGDSSMWTDCLGTVTRPDEKYVGEFRNGEPHGQGTLSFPDGAKYVGEFSNGQPHGQGTTTDSDGSFFVGTFRDGRVFGQGKLFSRKGYLLAEGNWSSDKDLVVADEPWHSIGGTANGSANFIATNSIRQSGHTRRAWILRAQPEPVLDKVLSIRSLAEFDCLEEKKRTLTAQAFSGHFGTGELLTRSNESDWQYIAPGTVAAGELRYVCDYKTTP
jgi:hypothetical protein